MNLKRIVGFLALALVVYFVVTQPETAADAVRSIGATLRNAADSVTTFVNELV